MQLLKHARLFVCNRGSRALAVFLAVMAVLTMASRAVDSLRIPQVVVCGFEEMKLEYPLEIMGRVGTVGKRALYCQENLRIENVWVQPNDTVEKGDLLFTLDKEDTANETGNSQNRVTDCRYRKRLPAAGKSAEFEFQKCASGKSGRRCRVGGPGQCGHGAE